MYLTRLEIQGFKSFVEKTQMDFGLGTAVIVGPNGCGKSNIADAIRWVLGEQSAKSLRGSKMEDVIFAGSEKRKPVGMAEVSITFDNSSGVLPVDFREVTITRRVFRSGESEYLINKVSCRLRDVWDLLQDTGIGREALTIIGQGKVDEVLNAKPEDRRTFLEEAAGIVKYRNRKKEALQKLAETKHHLERIGDLIHELGLQLQPLAVEAEAAARYAELQKEMEELELQVALRRLQGLDQKMEVARAEAIQAQTGYRELELQLNSLEADLEETRLLHLQREHRVGENQQRLLEETTKLERVEGLIGIGREKVNSILDQQERLRNDVDHVEGTVRQTLEQRTVEQNRYAEVSAELKKEGIELKRLEESLVQLESVTQEHETNIEQGKRRLFDLLSSLAAARNEVHQIEIQQKNLQSRGDRLRDRNQSLQKELLKSSSEKMEWQLRLDRDEECALELNSRIEGLGRKRGAVEKTLGEWRERTRQDNEQLQALRSRLAVLEDVIREKEGYFQGVKAVLAGRAQNDDRCGEVIGVVAEMIRVPVELETAVEMALGSAIQNMVTETDTGARRAVEFLKASGAGRATFLPLNALKERDGSAGVQKYISFPGVRGIAADLVQVEQRYATVTRFLLGSILVVNDLRVAMKIARQAGYSIKLVTLEGDVINPGGPLTGGAFRRKGRSLLGQSRQVREMKMEASRLEQQLADDQHRLKEVETEWLSFGEKIVELEGERQALQLTISSGQRELLRLEEQLKHLEEHSRITELEDEELGREAAGMQSRIQILHQQILSLGDEEINLNKEISGGQEQGRNVRYQHTALSEEVTEAKIRVARLKQEETSLRSNLDGLNRQVADYSRMVADKRQEMTMLSRRQSEQEADLASIGQEAVRLVEGQKQHQQLLLGAQADLQTARDNTNKQENQVKACQKQILLAKEQVLKAEVELTRLQTELAAETSNLEGKHGLTYEKAVARFGEGKPVPGGLFNRTRQLQKEIAALGTVNLGAVNEYQRLSERFDFLSGQREDLAAAESSLLEVVREMDKEMLQRFRTTFEAVSANFAVIFQSLFGGGYAELRLSDPDNLLETGIDVVAQPPGKKPQHMSLLSGGERALTAIALLFAVLETRPCPFCLLDEIEAALDEANVDRFAGFLQRLAEQTQFLIISHRQGTMEIADYLYGVTMEEPGISKMVSVQLREQVGKAG